MGDPWIASAMSGVQLAQPVSSVSTDCATSSMDGSRSLKVVDTNDLIGRLSLPHLAAFSSSLWAVPSTFRIGFHGGWRWIQRQPPSGREEWPHLRFRISRSLLKAERREAKDWTQKWERGNNKESPQEQQQWGRNRNLSWRLKPPIGRMPVKGDFAGSSSSGEMLMQGNPNSQISPPVVDHDMGRRFFVRSVGKKGITLETALSLYGVRYVARIPM